MSIDERKKRILHSVINEHIATAEPIGSRHIAKSLGLGLSSATIRNEMADLEEMGYLVQPHTSAGRIPSDKGYRFYVNELMTQYEPTLKELASLKRQMEIELGHIDKIISDASAILAHLTNYTAFLTSPQMKKGAIKTIELVPIDSGSVLIILVTHEGVMRNKRVGIPPGTTTEFIHSFSAILKEKLSGLTIEEITAIRINEIKEAMQSNYEMLFPILGFISEIVEDVRRETNVYLSGTTNIFNFPEYSDINRAREFLEFLDDKPSLAKALLPGENEQFSVNSNGGKHEITVRIGSENELDIMQRSSVITANYYVGDKVMGKLGIIGPTRMDYEKTIAKVGQISDALSKLLCELYADDNGG